MARARGSRAIPLIAATLGIALAACVARGPTTVSANEQPFPVDFLVAGAWEPAEIELPGSPRTPTLDALLQQTKDYLGAGVIFRPADGRIDMVVPNGASMASEVHIFVTIVGGSTGAHAGTQLWLVALHDDRGWRLDPTVQERVYCNRPLTGIRGTRCFGPHPAARAPRAGNAGAPA